MARVEVLFTNVAVNSVHLEEMHSVFGGRLGPPLSLDYRVNSCQSEFTLAYLHRGASSCSQLISSQQNHAPVSPLVSCLSFSGSSDIRRTHSTNMLKHLTVLPSSDSSTAWNWHSKLSGLVWSWWGTVQRPWDWDDTELLAAESFKSRAW